MHTTTMTTRIIRFTTRNSHYRFQWAAGDRWGWLFCEAGTYEGRAFKVCVEDVRDLAWPGEHLQADLSTGGQFVSSPIVSVDRSAAGF